jgi:adenylate kinase family enzyme
MAQGKEIALQLDIPYLSAGQLVVQAIEKQTTQGLQAKPHVEAKSMIPDGLMSGMSKAKRSEIIFISPSALSGILFHRLLDSEVSGKGFVLEGYPRTAEQLQILQSKGLIPTHFGV